MTLAIFDLDNTLIAGDSDHRWGEFACAEGLVDATGHAAANDRFLQDYQNGCLDIDAYLQFALSTFAGLNTAAVATLQQRFLNDYMFGGGFHCQTLDICRDGTQKSYFPYFDRIYDK